MLQQRLVLLPILAFSLGACGTKDDDKGDDASTDGTWKSGCNHSESTEGSVTTRSTSDVTFVISGSSLKVSSLSYDSNQDKCVTALSSTASEATFTATGDSAAVSGAQEITIKVSKTVTTPLTQGEVDEDNESKFCEATDWAINVPKDITTCGGSTEYFDLLKVDGNNLYFGDSDEEAHDGSTAAKRPVKLDINAFVKS